MKRSIIVSLVLVFCAFTAFAQNALVNGNFEVNPPTGFGNHITGVSVAPWVVSGTANLVKVDGPGGYSYGPFGNDGPQSDASAPGAGIAQHYLDITSDGTFYQAFTARCSGQVTYGGAFSTRANTGGNARIELRQGTGTSGALVGGPNSVPLSSGNSATDPWTYVSYTATLLAGQTYSLVVYMDNSLNFDNGFVNYSDCPAPDPCCPPWNSYQMEEMLIYHGTGGINAPYTLAFQPTALFNSQMQAYINYLNALNPAITQITIQFRLHDGGNGTTAVMGPQLGVSHYITWQAGLTAPFPPPTFFSGSAETMLVNHWYFIHTGMYLENNQMFFGADCADNDLGVRIQVDPLSLTPGTSATMQMRDSFGRIAEKRIPSNR